MSIYYCGKCSCFYDDELISKHKHKSWKNLICKRCYKKAQNEISSGWNGKDKSFMVDGEIYTEEDAFGAKAVADRGGIKWNI